MKRTVSQKREEDAAAFALKRKEVCTCAYCILSATYLHFNFQCGEQKNLITKGERIRTTTASAATAGWQRSWMNQAVTAASCVILSPPQSEESQVDWIIRWVALLRQLSYSRRNKLKGVWVRSPLKYKYMD